MIRDSRLAWHDMQSRRTETVTIDRFTWQADDVTSALTLDGAGASRSRPLTVPGELGSIQDLLGSRADPYPIALQATLGAIESRIEGHVSPRYPDGETHLEVILTGEALADLGELVGADLPPLGPYRLEAVVASDRDGGLMADPLRATIGGAETALLRAEGRIDDLVSGEGIRLRVEAEGATAALGDLLEVDLPALGAYAFEGKLIGSMEALALTHLTGAVGEDGTAVVRVRGGAIANVLTGEGIRASLQSEGSLAAVAELAGFELAPFGPYTFESTLVGSFGDLALTGIVATAGDKATRVSVAGAVEELLEIRGLDLAVEVEGTNLAALSPLVGFELPASDPYRLAGQITGSPRHLRIEGIEASVADSAITGWLSVDWPGGVDPRIEGELAADRFDLDRVLAMAEAAGDEQQATAAPAAADPAAPGDGGIFPDAPLPLDALTALRADLVFRAEQLVFEGAEFRNAKVNLLLQDGRLSLRDVTMQVASGAVSGDLVVEANRPAVEVVVRLNARGIKVGELMTNLGAATSNVRGEVDIDIDIDIDINSTGRSIDELLAELEGSAAIVAAEGRVEDVPLNLLVPDLDILNLLPSFWLAGEDDAVRVNCLVGEFEIDEGVVRTEALLDTRRMTLLGKGTVDLGEEMIDLALRPVSKSKKLSTATVPIDIKGRLAEPEIDPHLGEAAERAIRGILGGLLIPLNQIAALFGQKTADACADALGQARQRRAARGEAGASGSGPESAADAAGGKGG